jgi:hypothetical protein
MSTLATAARTLPWLLPLLVTGCSGTPFGEALSGSFSAGGPSPPAGQAPAPSTAAKPVPSQRPAASPPSAPPSPGGSGQGAAARPAAAPAGPPPSTRQEPPAKPAPYRLTILLPQADPAAPAEGVTRALRAAGVPFEVETIQRTGAAAAPVSTPAPAGSAAPAVRPAPPPSP